MVLKVLNLVITESAGVLADNSAGPQASTVQGCYAIKDIRQKLILIPNLVCPWLIYQLFNHFEIWHRAGSDTFVLCAKFQNDWTSETDVMGEWEFTRFEFKMSFRRISAPLITKFHLVSLNVHWLLIILSCSLLTIPLDSKLSLWDLAKVRCFDN